MNTNHLVSQECRVLVLLLVLSSLSNLSCGKKTSQAKSEPDPTPVSSQSTLPKQNGLINDYANVLDANAKSRIQPLLNDLLSDLDVEFAVVTVDTTGSQSVYDYSLAMTREWKLGKSGKGLLYLFAVKDRQWRIQVSTALEKELPNDVCARLHEPVLPLLKEGKYGEAVEKYVRAVDQRLRSVP